MYPATTVLIIEDDKNLSEPMQLHMEGEGLRCMTADNGTDGIASIQRKRPDLVVLDIMLPDIDGFQVCQQVRVTGEQKTRVQFGQAVYWSICGALRNGWF